MPPSGGNSLAIASVETDAELEFEEADWFARVERLEDDPKVLLDPAGEGRVMLELELPVEGTPRPRCARELGPDAIRVFMTQSGRSGNG